MKLRDCVKKGEELLQFAHIAEAKEEAKLLFCELFQYSLTDFLLHIEDETDPNQETAYLEACKKRANHIPLQLIVGHAPFYGEEFFVNGDVLIPRFDTEVLIDWVLEDFKDQPADVLDLCTGSGCIGITLKKNRPAFQVTCTDLSEKALKVAQKNAQNLQADITLKQGDLWEPVDGTYDLIVSNPPYIEEEEIETLEEEVKSFDPYMALSGGQDGLVFYRRIAADADRYLKENGTIYLEIGESQAADVAALFKEAGFNRCSIRKDLSNLDRVLKIQR